jgi:hypothetical protein
MNDRMARERGFRRRESGDAVVYAIDKGGAGVVFWLTLVFFGWLFAIILGFTVWVLVWLWLGGEGATDPAKANFANYTGLAVGIVAGLPLLLFFRRLWRRIGDGFSITRNGIVKEGRIIAWGEFSNLRLIDSTSGMVYAPGTADAFAMALASANGMALAVDAKGRRVLLAVALDLPRAERLLERVGTDVARLRAA